MHRQASNKAAFIITLSDNPNTDDDGDDDNEEARRRRFSDNQNMADAYRVLVDSGVDEYFFLFGGRPDEPDTDFDGLPDADDARFREVCGDLDNFDSPSPFSPDSDNDGNSDLAECINGTNPIRGGEPSTRGVDGLSNTILMSPDDFNTADFLNPPVNFRYWIRDNGQLGSYFMDSALYYDDDYNCVDGPCDLFDAWAADTEDDSFSCRVLGVRCDDDAKQIRNKIRELVEFQGVFDDDGNLKERYIALDAWVFCSRNYTGCDFEELEDTVDDIVRALQAPIKPDQLKSTRTITTGEEVRSGRAIPTVVVLTAATALIYKVYRDATTSDEERAERATEITRRCKANAAVLNGVDAGILHPCNTLAIFMPSVGDVGRAATLDAEHIAANPFDVVLNYNGSAASRARVVTELSSRGLNIGSPRSWYNQFPACGDGARTIWIDANGNGTDGCQEYPFFATAQSGPGVGVDTTAPRASIEIMDRDQNSLEGTAFGAFTLACPGVTSGQPFLVIPQVEVGAPPTDWVCRR